MTTRESASHRVIALAVAALAVIAIGVFAVGKRSAVLNSARPSSEDEPTSTLATSPTEQATEPTSNRASVPESEEHGDAPSQASAAAASAHIPIRLHGTVETPADPTARALARILLTDRDGIHVDLGMDASGYGIDGLSPGEYVLEAQARGMLSSRRTITLRAGESDHREDFRLEEGWFVRVRVLTPDGEDLADRFAKDRVPIEPAWIWVAATLDPPGGRLEGRTSEDVGVGRSVSWNDSGGETVHLVEVSADPPVYLSAALRELVLTTKRVETRIDSVDFVVDMASVRSLLAGLTLVVEHETGAPAIDASVSLATSGLMESGVHPDAQGRVTIEGQMPGPYDLEIFEKGYGSLDTTVTLEPGRIVDLGTIRLERGVEIRGRCVDERGEPVPVVPGLIPAPERQDDATLPTMVSSGRADGEDGRFVFRGLSAGRYVVWSEPASAPESTDMRWMFSPVVVDTRNGPVENLVLVARQPVPIVFRPTSDAVGGIDFEVRTADGFRVEGGTFKNETPLRVELPPAEYRLRLMRARKLVREIPISLRSELLAIDVDP
jgi:hypothetical protein